MFPVAVRIGHGRTALTASSVAVVGFVCALHYGTTLHDLGLHDVLRRLFYLPVIVAAIAGGLRGGLLAAGVAVIGYLPHLVQLQRAGDRVLDHALELVLLPLVALLVGGFADGMRRAQALAADRGRLAAVGEVGFAMMAQVEGPLSAIHGHAETLASRAGLMRDFSVGFSAVVIQEEVARVRRFFTDLRGLDRGDGRGPSSVSLAALLRRLAEESSESRGEPARVTVAPAEPDVRVQADPRRLAFAFRALLLAALDAVPGGRLRVIVTREPDGSAQVEVIVGSATGRVPDLEWELQAVFGASLGEYRFREALCLKLLAAEGARVEVRRSGGRQGRIQVRFPRALPNGRPGGQLARGRQT